MHNLYDPDLAARFVATEEFQNDGKRRDEQWPRACRGAANAWIILVGPSPGAPVDAEHPWPGGPNRLRDGQATISLHATAIDFANGKNRNQRWMTLIDQFTRDRKFTVALAAICNLDWQEQANAALVPEEYLRAGCGGVDQVIKTTKPRIVAALTVRVWDHLAAFYRNLNKIAEEIPCAGMRRNPLRLRLFEAFDTFLIKVRHPSWPVPLTERQAYNQFVKDRVFPVA